MPHRRRRRGRSFLLRRSILHTRRSYPDASVSIAAAFVGVAISGSQLTIIGGYRDDRIGRIGRIGSHGIALGPTDDRRKAVLPCLVKPNQRLRRFFFQRKTTRFLFRENSSNEWNANNTDLRITRFQHPPRPTRVDEQTNERSAPRGITNKRNKRANRPVGL